MSRYTRPRLKIIRRLGKLPGLTPKKPRSWKRPGQHGDSKRKVTQYSSRLKEKQKLRYHYGLTEKQLVNYVRKAKKSKGATGNSLIQLLELRLDNIVFRLGIGVSLQAARQEVTHRHIFVNSDCVSFPASACSLGDVISVDRSLLLRYQSRISKKKPLQLRSRRPRFLKRFHVDRKSRKFFGSIRRHPSYRELPFKLNVLLVIEYYSRKI